MWAASNPLTEVTCVSMEGVALGAAAAEPDDGAAASGSDSDARSRARLRSSRTKAAQYA